MLTRRPEQMTLSSSTMACRCSTIFGCKLGLSFGRKFGQVLSMRCSLLTRFVLFSAGFILLIAIFNVCDYTRFITDFSSSTFGFYVGVGECA